MLVNFFGKRGSGKTTTIRGQLPDCRGPVLVIDILGNFPNPEYVQVSEASQAIDAIKTYFENETETETTQKIIVVKCADPSFVVDYISAALWETGGTLVLDEVDSINISMAPCFDKVIRYGRNRNIDLITGCRRPAEISKNITAGANQVYCFQTQEPRDVDYFEKTLFGEKAEMLMSLPKFHGLYIDYDQDEIGTFRIDESGRIYKLSTFAKEVPINQISSRKEETCHTSKVSSCPPLSPTVSSASPRESRSSKESRESKTAKGKNQVPQNQLNLNLGDIEK